MSSRPSNSRRRATTEIAVESTSRHSISQPSTSRSTEVFRRPPLTPMTPDGNQGSSQGPNKGVSHLPPHPYHPYTPASYHYHTSAPAVPVVSNTHLQPEPYMSTLSPTASSVNVDPANPKHMMVQQTYYVHHHYYNHHLAPPQVLPPNPPQSPPPPSERRAPQISQTLFQRITGSTLVQKYRRVILVLLFLPLPPLLSVLYVIVGHSLLRRASSSSPTTTDSRNPWSPSLLSSANAAATGGIILSLPLFLTLYVILPSSYHAQTRSRTPRDDFFEDDDEVRGGALARVLDIAGYLACVIILICVGGAASALGVTCLAGKQGMLTAGRAAEAGIVGGAVLLAAVLAGTVVGLVAWWLWMSRGRIRGVEEEKN